MNIRSQSVFREQRLLAVAFTLLCLVSLSLSFPAHGQDSGQGLDDIVIPRQSLPLCFGFSDVQDARALAVCDALNLRENVKARELSEQWVRQDPNNPAAQFALSEVLLSVEGNMPRALFHLNRAEELMPYATMTEAFDAGELQWHYLTISQLSYIHQLMGDQYQSLAYLDKLEEIYGQDVESFRGWPLIKLKEYDLARESANRVLQDSDDERERARAWNTLCAVELASLAPIESTSACDRAIDEDEDIANRSNDGDTVYLTNASEVALSLLEIDKAESYIDRASRVLNPDSVADPWIYKLYLTLNQGRFDEARTALDRMMIWHEQQEPLVNVMNRAEHHLVSAAFLLVAGYAEDASKLSLTALNQPDRNGSYSADDAQKDALAALINMIANRTELQRQLELRATMGLQESLQHRLHTLSLGLQAWRAERRAAALFADFEVLQNRLRPYAPLEVHIPEWIEPELVGLIGTGIIADILEQANANGSFQLNQGYYHAYRTEIAALDWDDELALQAGLTALAELPQQEVMLRARIEARMADIYWQRDNVEQALLYYQQAYRHDPSIMRRLGLQIPVEMRSDNSQFADLALDYLENSPRFEASANGLLLTTSSAPDQSICLRTRAGEALSCYTAPAAENLNSSDNARALVDGFHTNTFGLGFDISKAQRSILLGSSVILSSQNDPNLQRNRDTFLNR